MPLLEASEAGSHYLSVGAAAAVAKMRFEDCSEVLQHRFAAAAAAAVVAAAADELVVTQLVDALAVACTSQPDLRGKLIKRQISSSLPKA